MRAATMMTAPRTLRSRLLADFKAYASSGPRAPQGNRSGVRPHTAGALPIPREGAFLCPSAGSSRIGAEAYGQAGEAQAIPSPEGGGAKLKGTSKGMRHDS